MLGRGVAPCSRIVRRDSGEALGEAGGIVLRLGQEPDVILGRDPWARRQVATNMHPAMARTASTITATEREENRDAVMARPPGG
jgi:hypothetical protein